MVVCDSFGTTTNILDSWHIWEPASGSSPTPPFDPYSFQSGGCVVPRARNTELFFISGYDDAVVAPGIDDYIQISSNGAPFVEIWNIFGVGSIDVSGYIPVGGTNPYAGYIGQGTILSFEAVDCTADDFSCSNMYVVKVDGSKQLPSKTGDTKANSKEPINSISGNLWFENAGLTVPCPGMPLSFERKYNSVQTGDGIMGKGWAHSYDWSIGETNTTFAGHAFTWKVLRTGGGDEYNFCAGANNTFDSPLDANLSMTYADSKYRVTAPGNIFFSFNTSNILESISNLWGQTVTLSYSNYLSTNLITKVQHSNGQCLDYTYTSNRLTKVQASTNLYMTFAYNSLGQMTNATRVIGNTSETTSYEYTGDYLTKKTDPVGTPFSYMYATNFSWYGATNNQGTNVVVGTNYYQHYVEYPVENCSYIRYIRDGATLSWQYVYDLESKRLMAVASPTNAFGDVPVVEYEYDENGDIEWETRMENSQSEQVWSLYDACHNPTNVSYRWNSSPYSNNMWKYTWDTNNQQLTSVIDPEGSKVGFEYTNALLSKTRLYYNSTSSYDTILAYTTNGLLDSVTNANGHWVRHQYDQYGFPTSTIPQTGPVTYSTYTSLGILQTVRLPDGDPQQAGGSGGMGPPPDETNPTPRIVTYRTDAIGKVTNIVHLTNTMQEYFFWDATGNLTNHVDTAGRSTRFTYKPTGKMDSVSRTVGGSNLTTYLDYDNQFNTVRVKDAKGRLVESYQLDGLDRVIGVTNLENQSMTVAHLTDSKLYYITRFDGTTVYHGYDTDGRLSAIQYPDVTLRSTYLKNGALSVISNSTIAVSNSYNYANQITNVTVTGLATVPLSTKYSYLPAGNVSNVISAAGTNTLTYDAAERVSTISQSRAGLSPLTFNIGYNGTNGMIQSLTCTNSGLSLAVTYDMWDRISTMAWGTTNMSRTFSYGYNSANMITGFGDTGAGENLTYGYDELDRLTSELHVDTSGKTNFNESIVYDEVGNRTSKTRDGVTVSYSYSNGCNRLTGWNVTQTNLYTQLDITGTSSEEIGWNSHWGTMFVSNGATTLYPNGSGSNFWLYDFQMGMGAQSVVAAIRDQAGNTSYKTSSVTLSIVTNATYGFNTAGCVTNISYTGNSYSRNLYLTWNQQYQLSECRTNGVAVERNGYDALGRRVWSWDGTSTNYFQYDGDNLVAELNSTGALRRAYVYLGLDFPIAMISYTGTSVQTYFYLNDANGTVRGIVNEAGTLVESYRLDAWGRVLGVYNGAGTPITESAIGNRLILHGREYSWKTGLYYFRARWADPVSGRFISKDPIRVLAGVNEYQFISNNPVNNRDSFGLCEGSDSTTWNFLSEINPFNMDGSLNNQVAAGFMMTMGDTGGAEQLSGINQLYMGGASEATTHAYGGSIGVSAFGAGGAVLAGSGLASAAYEGLGSLVARVPLRWWALAGAGGAAGASSRGRMVGRSAANLAEQLTMKEAQAGAGKVIMEGPFGDSLFKGAGWVKMQHVHTIAGGAKVVVHYMKNTLNGITTQFKFK